MLNEGSKSICNGIKYFEIIQTHGDDDRSGTEEKDLPSIKTLSEKDG